MFIFLYIFAWVFCIYTGISILRSCLQGSKLIEWAKIKFYDKSWQL